MGLFPVLGLAAGILFLGRMFLSKKPTINVSEIESREESPEVVVPKPDVPDEELVDNEIKKELEVKKLPFSSLKVPKFIRDVLPSLTVTTPSGSIEDSDWQRYVKSVISAGQKTVSPNYNLGMFLINMRTLEDFGYVKKVTKQKVGDKTVWKGDWAGPYSLEKFLSDGNLQYEVFLKMSKIHFENILKKYKNRLYDINNKIEDITPTISGLMAVAKVAGLGGLDKWLNGDRRSTTTDAYKRSNGVF